MNKKEFEAESRMIIRLFPDSMPVRGVLVGSSVSETWMEFYCGFKIPDTMREILVPDKFAPAARFDDGQITESPMERFRRIPIWTWDEKKNKPRRTGSWAWTRYE